MSWPYRCLKIAGCLIGILCTYLLFNRVNPWIGDSTVLMYGKCCFFAVLCVVWVASWFTRLDNGMRDCAESFIGATVATLVVLNYWEHWVVMCSAINGLCSQSSDGYWEKFIEVGTWFAVYDAYVRACRYYVSIQLYFGLSSHSHSESSEEAGPTSAV